MGASGAGKTTLLNVLSCRVAGKALTGKLHANGKEYNY
jgi:ABC-type multidrug transport system ATPase subunit